MGVKWNVGLLDLPLGCFCVCGVHFGSGLCSSWFPSSPVSALRLSQSDNGMYFRRLAIVLDGTAGVETRVGIWLVSMCRLLIGTSASL